MEPMFCPRMLRKKSKEYNRKLHKVFVKLEKAHDTILRELIRQCLRKRPVLEAYINTIKDLYRHSMTLVATNARETDEIKVEVDLHQSYALSPLLFTIIMDIISEHTEEDTP